MARAAGAVVGGNDIAPTSGRARARRVWHVWPRATFAVGMVVVNAVTSLLTLPGHQVPAVKGQRFPRGLVFGMENAMVLLLVWDLWVSSAKTADMANRKSANVAEEMKEVQSATPQVVFGGRSTSADPTTQWISVDDLKFPSRLSCGTWLVTVLFRTLPVALGPDDFHEAEDPSMTSVLYKVVLCSFYTFSHLTWFVFPAWLLRRDGLLRVRRSLMNPASVFIVLYGYAIINLLWAGVDVVATGLLSPALWVTVLLCERGKDMYGGNVGHTIVIAQFFASLAIMITAVATASMEFASKQQNQSLYSLLAVSLVHGLAGVARYLFERTLRFVARADPLMQESAGFFNVWVVELATELLFLQVDPFSSTFFVLLIANFVRTYAMRSGVLLDAKRWLQRTRDGDSPPSRGIIYQMWRDSERFQLIDPLATTLVLASMGIESLLGVCCNQTSLLLGGMNREDVPLLFFAYGTILATQLVTSFVVRASLSRRLETFQHENQDGTRFVSTLNPLARNTPAEGARAAPVQRPRRASADSAGVQDLLSEDPTNAYWSKHIGVFMVAGAAGAIACLSTVVRFHVAKAVELEV